MMKQFLILIFLMCSTGYADEIAYEDSNFGQKPTDIFNKINYIGDWCFSNGDFAFKITKSNLDNPLHYTNNDTLFLKTTGENIYEYTGVNPNLLERRNVITFDMDASGNGFMMASSVTETFERCFLGS